ncbi:hypothetical protein GGI02_003306 [Coemansia sp. RSA 2322]|nr:hypothetical protein GGI02_003306 [Coemansia sp. RSA 2322]
MHTLHCYAIPVYCEYISDGAYVLGVRDGVVLDDTECASRQHSPVGPRLTEAPPCIPDLYYWSQTRSDVTMCIQLPISVTAQQIQCVLTRVALTLTFADAPECESKYAFNHAALCGGIVADESVWTLENGRLLTLYLQKVHEGARWPTLFGTDDGVLETMDPNEFAVIRERLEGHTSDTLDLRRPTGVSAMQLTNEARDQEDDELGQENASIVFSVRDWRTGQASASSVAGSPDWLCPSFPRPLSKRHGSNDGGDNAARNGLAPVCLGFDVDGAVFGFNGGDMRSVSGGRETMHADASSGTSAIAAEARPQHWGTFAALSYIQASKRERRFVYVDPDLSVAVLAESQRRIYVYHQAADMRSTTAAQSIVDLGCADAAGESEELLGIQLFGRLRGRVECLMNAIVGLPDMVEVHQGGALLAGLCSLRPCSKQGGFVPDGRIHECPRERGHRRDFDRLLSWPRAVNCTIAMAGIAKAQECVLYSRAGKMVAVSD